MHSGLELTLGFIDIRYAEKLPQPCQATTSTLEEASRVLVHESKSARFQPRKERRDYGHGRVASTNGGALGTYEVEDNEMAREIGDDERKT